MSTNSEQTDLEIELLNRQKNKTDRLEETRRCINSLLGECIVPSKVADITEILRTMIINCRDDEQENNSDIVDLLGKEIAWNNQIKIDLLTVPDNSTESLLQLVIDFADKFVYEKLVNVGFLKYAYDGRLEDLRQLLVTVKDYNECITMETDGFCVALKKYHTTTEQNEIYSQIVNFFFEIIEENKKYRGSVCKLDINHPLTYQEVGNVPLYYALRYGNDEMIFRLLSYGAHLDIANSYGLRPADFIRMETLKGFLDQLIEFDDSDVSYRVKMNHDPVRIDSDKSNLMAALIDNAEFHDLILHPVIATVLSIKWYQFRFVLYLDCFLKFLCILSVALLPIFPNNLLMYSMVFLLLAISLWWNRKSVLDLSALLCMSILLTVWMIPSPNDMVHYRDLTMALSLIFSSVYTFSLLLNLSKFAVYVEMFKIVTKHCLGFLLFFTVPILLLSMAIHVQSNLNLMSYVDIIYKLLRLLFLNEASDSLGNVVLVMVPILFIIGVIATNLMIGLAVNDISTIQKDAEALVYIGRARFILAMENNDWIFSKITAFLAQPEKYTASLVEKRMLKLGMEKYDEQFQWCLKIAAAFRPSIIVLYASSLSVINDIFQERYRKMYNFKNFVLKIETPKQDDEVPYVKKITIEI